MSIYTVLRHMLTLWAELHNAISGSNWTRSRWTASGYTAELFRDVLQPDSQHKASHLDATRLERVNPRIWLPFILNELNPNPRLYKKRNPALATLVFLCFVSCMAENQQCWVAVCCGGRPCKLYVRERVVCRWSWAKSTMNSVKLCLMRRCFWSLL